MTPSPFIVGSTGAGVSAAGSSRPGFPWIRRVASRRLADDHVTVGLVHRPDLFGIGLTVSDVTVFEGSAAELAQRAADGRSVLLGLRTRAGEGQPAPGTARAEVTQAVGWLIRTLRDPVAPEREAVLCGLSCLVVDIVQADLQHEDDVTLAVDDLGSARVGLTNRRDALRGYFRHLELRRVG